MSDDDAPDVMAFGQDPRYAAWIAEQPWLDPTIANKLRAAIAEDRNSTLKETNHV